MHVAVRRGPVDVQVMGLNGKPCGVHITNFDVQAPDGSPHALGFSDPNLPMLTDRERDRIRTACAELTALGIYEPPEEK